MDWIGSGAGRVEQVEAGSKLRREASRLRQGGPGSKAGVRQKLHTMKEDTLNPGIIQVTKNTTSENQKLHS